MSRRFRLARGLLAFSRLDQMRHNLEMRLDQAGVQDPRAALDNLAALDPSGASGKYLLTPWMVGLVLNGNIRWPEDSGRLGRALTWWWVNKDKLPRDSRQITRTTTLHDLEDWQESIQPSRREVIREHKTLGAEVLLQKPPYTLLKITTPEAAEIYGRGTKWCTVEHETCSDYLQSGPLYIVQRGGQAYLQAHLEEHQLMQADDRPATKKQTELVVELLEQARVSIPIQFKIETIPYIITPKEFEVIKQDPELGFLYSRNVLRGRFHAGEAVIAQYPPLAYSYAKLYGPFPEGEPAIASNSEYAFLYVVNVLHGRFPAGEPAIALSPVRSRLYAEMLGERFLAGEPAIARDVVQSRYYAENILHDPHPETWGDRYLAQHRIKN